MAVEEVDGDLIANEQWRCWYRGTNGDIGGNGCGDTKNANQGFRDPIYQLCGADRYCRGSVEK